MSANGPRPRIECAGLGIKFKHNTAPKSLKGALVSLMRPGSADTDFWAVRGVDLNIRPGEVWGLIGDNGSGKSTLLKMIVGIYAPDEGKVVTRGKVQALLELGTGFHPDLSGRENIYINASLLGWTKKHVDSVYEKIVDFAELKEHIDFPLKHYSSGMQARLGFSIAVHTDPDILILDEILAVGDMAFQYKCFEKIKEFLSGGKTVILVSHNLDAIKNLTGRAAYMKQGRLAAAGKTPDVVSAYVTDIVEREKSVSGRAASLASTAEPGEDVSPECKRWGNGNAVIPGVEFRHDGGSVSASYRMGEKFLLRIRYDALEPVEDPVFGVAIYKEDGTHVCGPNTRFAGFTTGGISGPGHIDYILDSMPLMPGVYDLSVSIYDKTGIFPLDHRHKSFRFRVLPNPSMPDSYGVIHIPNTWEMGKG